MTVMEGSGNRICMLHSNSVATFGQQWKFNTPWTLKDVIVLDWADQIGVSSHYPKPFYFDYRVVLSISKCTGHARRISLWELFKEEALHTYLGQAFTSQIYKDFEFLVKFFPSEASFVELWRSISADSQELLKTIAKEVLNILRSTGVVKDDYLKVWDITSSFDRLDGRKVKPSWSSMVKDDSACATFAVITETCIKFERPARTPSTKLASSIFSTILNTAICFTIPQQLVNEEYHVYTFPNSLQDDELRPEWALSTTTFKKWKVQISEDHRSTQEVKLESTRKQLIESTRDQDRMDPEASQRLESRHSARLLRAQKRSPKSEITTAHPPQTMQQGPLGTASSIPPPRTSDQWSSYRGKMTSESDSSLRRKFNFDDAFEVKNGEGEGIGWLVLESPSCIDLYSISEGSSLLARWEERKPGILSAVEAKEKEMDLRLVRWSEKRMGAIFPWAVSKLSEAYDGSQEPFVLEHIRGGPLKKAQKVLQTFIS